jgi:hypothetical protein
MPPLPYVLSWPAQGQLNKKYRKFSTHARRKLQIQKASIVSYTCEAFHKGKNFTPHTHTHTYTEIYNENLISVSRKVLARLHNKNEADCK